MTRSCYGIAWCETENYMRLYSIGIPGSPVTLDCHYVAIRCYL